MSLRRGTLEVRSRGGSLSSKVHPYYVVLTREALIYFNKREDYKKKVGAQDTVKLSDISDVQAVKSKSPGFTFEVKTPQIRSQHLCKTEDERQKWIYMLMKAKTDTGTMKEFDSSDGDLTPRSDFGADSPPGTPKDSPDGASSGSGTTIITPAALRPRDSPREPLSSSSGIDRAKVREEFFSKLSKGERRELLDGKLKQQAQGEEEQLLKKWREEKSAILDVLRKREVEAIESTFQQKQLDLEKDFQERRGKAVK